MVNIIEVRKVMQDVLLFVWLKHGSVSGEPTRISNLIPDISDELMNNLSVSIWIESFRTLYIWDDFFKMHFERMTSSSKLFANYVAYVCYILNESPNACECFVDILSIVSEFSLRCLEGNCKKYLNTCVDLFCTFFTNEINQKFEDQGGWNKLNEHIGKTYNLTQIKFMISEEKPPANLYKYFLDAFETKNKPDYKVGGVALKKTKPYYVVNGFNLKDITSEQVESHEKAMDFAESIQGEIEKLVQKTFDEIITEFWKTEIQVKHLYGWEDDLSNEMEEAPFTTVKYRNRKRQLERYSLQEVQSSTRMQNKEGQPKIDKKSSDKKKRQSEQCSSRNSPAGSKEVQRTKDQESFGGIKYQMEQYSCQKGREPSGGKKGKEATRTKDTDFSGEITSQAKCYLREFPKLSVGVQSKEALWRKDDESSGEIENKGKRDSSGKVPKLPGALKSREAQQRKNTESSGEIKNQMDPCLSRKVPKSSDALQSKEAQQRKVTESSAGTKNQVKDYSQNVKEASKNTSCESEVTKKELEVKTVTPRDLLKSPNRDTTNLQDSVTPAQSSHLKQESTKIEKTKTLMSDMSYYIREVYKLVQSLCEKHGVQVPAQLQINNNT